MGLWGRAGSSSRAVCCWGSSCLLWGGRGAGWALSAGLCLFTLALSGINLVRFVMLAVFCGVLAF